MYVTVSLGHCVNGVNGVCHCVSLGHCVNGVSGCVRLGNCITGVGYVTVSME